MSSSLRRRATLFAALATLVVPFAAIKPADAVPIDAVPADAVPAAAVRKVPAAVRAQLAAAGTATFWVVLDGEANLTGARKQSTKDSKGAYVYRAKTEYARRSQAGLRTLLTERGADFTPFWITNAIKVTGGAKLLAEIAARPEVEAVLADDPVPLPDPVPATAAVPPVNGVEWNVDRIGAPRVWNELGVRGEGIVVATIDTGAQFDHPALIGNYRGSIDGRIDHNYNWFDPGGICPNRAPCDNSSNGHGTHTLGTLAGRTGGSTQIGVAPNAKWITAKGCETPSGGGAPCSFEGLLASGQWMLAPTDLNGQNPRPDLAPDVVSNSWGRGAADEFYQDIVQAWVAAGIFPAFSAGNFGEEEGCDGIGWPGGLTATYAAGATDSGDTVHPDSSRGPGQNGEIKPDIVAPGVDVRSSLPGGAYGSLSGTSMASPHVAGAVALLWSAAPAVEGDIAATRQLLDDTALDIDDTSCGGTADDNNVAGEGRLDARAAAGAGPIAGAGTLAVLARRQGDNQPVADVIVTLTGPRAKTVSTGTDGRVNLKLLPGTYAYTARRFGFQQASGNVTITQGGTVPLNLTLTQLATATLSGTVTGPAGPLASARVELVGTPLSTTTGASGAYQLTVPVGSYTLAATPDPAAAVPSRCVLPGQRSVTVSGPTAANVTLAARRDTFGYTCGSPVVGYQAGSTRLPLTVDGVQQVALPSRCGSTARRTPASG